jgi:hypothetical protein
VSNVVSALLLLVCRLQIPNGLGRRTVVAVCLLQQTIRRGSQVAVAGHTYLACQKSKVLMLYIYIYCGFTSLFWFLVSGNHAIAFFFEEINHAIACNPELNLLVPNKLGGMDFLDGKL